MQENFDFGVPPTGRSCPQTSYDAADKMSHSAPTLREAVYGFIKSKGSEGATAYEVFLEFGLDKNKTSPRISELKKMGYVINTGRTRKADGCGSSVVWEVIR
jgi:hypothetical protein